MVKLNQEKCIGCGICSSLCPNTFSMVANGKAEVINSADTDCAKNAAENCPVEAIKVN